MRAGIELTRRLTFATASERRRRREKEGQPILLVPSKRAEVFTGGTLTGCAPIETRGNVSGENMNMQPTNCCLNWAVETETN
jgi:hypothetical protein